MRRIILIFMLFMLAVQVSAFEDTFQRPDGYALSDNWNLYEVNPGCTSLTLVQTPAEYPTSQTMRLHTSGPTGPFCSSYAFNYDVFSPDYFAFTVRATSGNTAAYRAFFLNLYDVDGILVETYTLTNFLTTYYDNDRYEFVKTGGNYILYINGVSNGSVGFAPSEDVSLSFQIDRTTANVYMTIDDFTSGTSIIGMNENWTEAQSSFDASYGIRSYASFPTSIHTMNARKISTGETVNTTEVSSISDFVSWNRLTAFGTDYGIYQAVLKRDTETLATAVFNYGYSQNLGSIYFDKGSYTQGETATITYSLVTPDFSTYDYEAKIIDLSGNTLETWDITTASDTKTSTLSDYNTGIHYVLFTRSEGATDIEFAYDFMTVTDTVSIYGNTTNVLTGAKISSINVSYLQSSTYKNETSDTNGLFQVDNFQTGVAITSAIRENSTALWQYSPFSFAPLASGLFTMDMMLFPINHSYVNATAYGLVTDSVYNNPIESANVTLQNGSWSDTATSTATGYYYFTNLSEGEYTINASATGFITSTPVNVTVPPAVNISWNASDNATGWTSSNSLSVNTTEKKEGVGSLESNGSALLDYSTTTSLVNTTTDYGRTNLSFWYYVNDTSKLTGDVNVTVGSSAEFGNDTVLLSFANTTLSNGWNYIEMPLFNGTLTGTLNMSTMDSFKLEVSKTGAVLSLLDAIRYTQDTRQVRYDIQLARLYDLTITAKSSTTNALIQSFSIYEGSNTYGTVTSTYTIENMAYGAYAVTVASDGYYSSGKTILMDEDKEVVFTLTPTPSGFYQPHEVKFILKSLIGRVYPEVATTVYLMSDENTVYLTGITGTDGAVDFQLIQNVHYKLTFVNASLGVDKTIKVYPKDTEYTIVIGVFGLIPDDRIEDDILYGTAKSSINLTTGYVNATFNDTSNTTTLAEFWVNNTNGTNVYYTNTTNSTETFSALVPGGNATYMTRFKITNTVMSDPLEVVRSVKFNDVVRYSLGLDEGWKYQLIAIVFIFFVGLLGSALNADKMAVIVVLSGWFFLFLGWLTAGASVGGEIGTGLALMLATLLAFGNVVRKGDVG